ncbi:MAG: ABC transporter ATP-binding protein [Ruminococcus sp.]|uniref:ABC transporter ATP-binding protein n=1 Tax=Ruminococcus sp. TaxID=41978 RepID=UPI0025E658CC|nr:ABC transporter ATP-binding protein [Ruminococcus sp.]MCR5599615.1 ABC transporter ATP-binding protein [Ruminococcus sp.]
MAKVIEVNNVYKSFGKGESITNVLSGASLSVENGEFVSLMGASGSGKSTLLYLIGGLDRNFEGNISICGSDIGKMKEKALSALRLEKIGFIFQFYNLVQNLNVEDNILLPSSVKGKSKAEMKAKLDEILKITGLTEKRKAKPAQLSGGQQQRVAIARAVIGDPEIILADEPTGNLDSNAGAEIMNLFSEINKKKGITILQVTHSDKCAAYGDRVIELVNGKTDIHSENS